MVRVVLSYPVCLQTHSAAQAAWNIQCSCLSLLNRWGLQACTKRSVLADHRFKNHNKTINSGMISTPSEGRMAGETGPKNRRHPTGLEHEEVGLCGDAYPAPTWQCWEVNQPEMWSLRKWDPDFLGQHQDGVRNKEPGPSSAASLLCPLLETLGTALVSGGQEGPGIQKFCL